MRLFKSIAKTKPYTQKKHIIVEHFAYKIVITILTAIVQYVAVPKIILLS